MSWEVRFRASVEKDVARLPADIRESVSQAIAGLSIEPLPSGCKKLKGVKNRFRLKIRGDYRVVYSIFREKSLIVVEFVGHRKDAYRWF
jgi:mRNA interferase RelE/StbE